MKKQHVPFDFIQKKMNESLKKHNQIYFKIMSKPFSAGKLDHLSRWHLIIVALISVKSTLIECDFGHIGNTKFKLMCTPWYCIIIQKSIKDLVSCNSALFIGYLVYRFHDIQFIHAWILWIEAMTVSVADRKIDIISDQKYFMHRYLRTERHDDF